MVNVQKQTLYYQLMPGALIFIAVFLGQNEVYGVEVEVEEEKNGEIIGLFYDRLEIFAQ